MYQTGFFRSSFHLIPGSFRLLSPLRRSKRPLPSSLSHFVLIHIPKRFLSSTFKVRREEETSRPTIGILTRLLSPDVQPSRHSLRPCLVRRLRFCGHLNSRPGSRLLVGCEFAEPFQVSPAHFLSLSLLVRLNDPHLDPKLDLRPELCKHNGHVLYLCLGILTNCRNTHRTKVTPTSLSWLTTPPTKLSSLARRP